MTTDPSRALSSSVASSFETHRFAMLLRMRSETLMVRSAATPRVSNHQARWVPDCGSMQLENASVAPHDIDGLFFTVAPGNRHGLLGATRHIRPVGRYDLRWKSMYPVPGNIIRIGVMDIA